MSRHIDLNIVKKPSMRDAFWNRVYELAKEDRDLVIVSADQNSPTLDDDFRPKLPSQFLNVGIAEQNAILVAAGLALGGKKTFAHAIAPFITLRCLEQIKMEMAVMKIPVTVVGVGAGWSYADSGPTHHTLEDIAALRVFPNILVHNISDDAMAIYFAEEAYRNQRPRYIRLDREACPIIHGAGTDFSKGIEILQGSDKSDLMIVASGNMTHRALAVYDELLPKFPNMGVVEVYTFPINPDEFYKAMKSVKRVVTLEEHYLPGGVGSAVVEALADAGITVPVKRIGAEPRYCYEYGGRQNIQSLYELDQKSIVEKILAFME